MSRIHEALKRAEQERANQTGGVPADPSAPAAARGETSSGVLVADPAVGVGSLGVLAAPSSKTGDAWLARCASRPWNPDLRTMLFFQSAEGVAGTEEFRTLRSRMYQIRERQPLKKILVTSALPKEGKSFVSANLAQVLVQQRGCRTLLIDGDLRGARLHLALGTNPSPGLTEYLSGECDETEIIQAGPMEGLYFVPAGKVMPNPAELISSDRLKVLLQAVGPTFDWIIIDSPPVVPVSDASILANLCDGVLIVVRSNSTPSDLARRAREEFSEKILLGVVLNGVDAGSSPYSRYYYGVYGYQPGAEAE